MTFVVPIRLKLGLNSREHWRAKAKRVKQERGWTTMAAYASRKQWPDPRVAPIVVTLTKVSPSVRKTDSDNLPGCAKAVRDAIAAIMLMDDGDDRIEWRYAQRRGSRHEVEVRIERAP